MSIPVPRANATEGANTSKLRCILAIDPGSAKCGVAVVRSDATTLVADVIERQTLIEFVRRAVLEYSPVHIVCGGGTGSRTCIADVQSAAQEVPFETVDESHTTEEARRRYLQSNPARGWQRLLPIGLRTPDQPVDGFVAVILAERWWRDHPDESSS